MRDNPKISIIIPSYNQGAYIEQTIKSILAQTYSNYEIILMDGGSTDQTVEIIKRYESDIAYWVSEKDGGQTNAINKGFAKATGEIVCWLNTDDFYSPVALEVAADTFSKHPEAAVVYGDYFVLRANGEIIYKPKISFHYRTALYAYLPIAQPASFFSKSAVDETGALDESLHLCMDYDFFLRLSKIGDMVHVPVALAYFRLHDSSKSSQYSFKDENKQVREGILGRKWTPVDKLMSKAYLGRAWLQFLFERRKVITRKSY